MIDVKTKSDEQLKFITKDCEEAVAARPRNPKAIEYIQTMRACDKEIEARNRLRMYRHDLKAYLYDDLENTIGTKYWTSRKRIREQNKTAYSIDRFRSACWMIYGYKKFNLI